MRSNPGRSYDEIAIVIFISGFDTTNLYIGIQSRGSLTGKTSLAMDMLDFRGPPTNQELWASLDPAVPCPSLLAVPKALKVITIAVAYQNHFRQPNDNINR